jgi:hypothetical protein
MSLIFHGICLVILCGFGRRLECDLLTELGDLPGEALGFGLGGLAVEVVGAEVLVEASILEHVIDGGQDRCRDGADRLLRAVSGLQAEELGPVVAALRPLGRSGALDERGLQPGGALAQSRSLALSGALVLAGTHARPSNQMGRRFKAAHVRGTGQAAALARAEDAGRLTERLWSEAKAGLKTIRLAP